MPNCFVAKRTKSTDAKIHYTLVLRYTIYIVLVFERPRTQSVLLEPANVLCYCFHLILSDIVFCRYNSMVSCNLLRSVATPGLQLNIIRYS